MDISQSFVLTIKLHAQHGTPANVMDNCTRCGDVVYYGGANAAFSCFGNGKLLTEFVFPFCESCKQDADEAVRIFKAYTK